MKRPAPGWFGWFMMVLGLYPMLLAFDVFGTEVSVNAPSWVLVLIGFVFVIAGAMVLLGHHSRVNDALAAVVLFCMAVCGAWVALFSSAEGFSGGLPFLSREANVALGRVVFGTGALITVAIAAYALKRAARQSG